MKVDAPARWWRRKEWLLVLVFAILIYPLLLMGSSDFGSSVGLNHDVNARRALARALSYAADPRLPMIRGNDGEVVTPALDANLVAMQLVDGSGGSFGSAPAPVVTTGSPTSTRVNGSNPTANLGGGLGGSAQPPSATTAPAGGPPLTPPPVAPSRSPTPVPRPVPSPTLDPTPSPTPTPTPNCNQPPAGGGTFDGTVRDPNGKKVNGGATLRLYWNSCLIATVVTGKKGTFAIPGLAPGTRYSYVATAPQFNSGSGAFTTDGNGDHSEDPQLQ